MIRAFVEAGKNISVVAEENRINSIYLRWYKATGGKGIFLGG